MIEPVRRLIVVVSGTRWDRTRLGVHHVAQHLTEYAPVLFVDAPESRSSARRHTDGGGGPSGPRLRQLTKNLYRLTPPAPPAKTRPGVASFTSLIFRRALKKAVRTLGSDVHAVVAYSSHTAIFGACRERHRVYYSADDLTAGAALTGRSPGRVARIEGRLAADADVIVAASPVLAEKWEALGFKALLIPNGVDDNAFSRVDTAPLPDDVTLPHPIAGYIGHLSDRIDFRLLEAIAARGTSLLLVGPRQSTFKSGDRLTRLLGRPNVQWVGPKRFDELPTYMRAMDVGLVPYADTPFNRASFPLKTLEYLAAGRAVVSTPLPSTRWLDTDLIAVAEHPTEFAGAVARQAMTPLDPDVVARRQEIARGHSWAQRVRELASVLELVDTTE